MQMICLDTDRTREKHSDTRRGEGGIGDIYEYGDDDAEAPQRSRWVFFARPTSNEHLF